MQLWFVDDIGVVHNHRNSRVKVIHKDFRVPRECCILFLHLHFGSDLVLGAGRKTSDNDRFVA